MYWGYFDVYDLELLDLDEKRQLSNSLLWLRRNETLDTNLGRPFKFMVTFPLHIALSTCARPYIASIKTYTQSGAVLLGTSCDRSSALRLWLQPRPPCEADRGEDLVLVFFVGDTKFCLANILSPLNKLESFTASDSISPISAIGVATASYDGSINTLTDCASIKSYDNVIETSDGLFLCVSQTLNSLYWSTSIQERINGTRIV
jgi:hypothetical protein